MPKRILSNQRKPRKRQQRANEISNRNVARAKDSENVTSTLQTTTRTRPQGKRTDLSGPSTTPQALEELRRRIGTPGTPESLEFTQVQENRLKETARKVAERAADEQGLAKIPETLASPEELKPKKVGSITAPQSPLPAGIETTGAKDLVSQFFEGQEKLKHLKDEGQLVGGTLPIGPVGIGAGGVSTAIKVKTAATHASSLGLLTSTLGLIASGGGSAVLFRRKNAEAEKILNEHSATIDDMIGFVESGEMSFADAQDNWVRMQADINESERSVQRLNSNFVTAFLGGGKDSQAAFINYRNVTKDIQERRLLAAAEQNRLNMAAQGLGVPQGAV